eukprot:scaffold289203_cov19-Prasinocladus_malaysianus.AAC.1
MCAEVDIHRPPDRQLSVIMWFPMPFFRMAAGSVHPQEFTAIYIMLNLETGDTTLYALSALCGPWLVMHDPR